MLFKNDLFDIDGTRHRLLHIEPDADSAWVIAVADKHAWPRKLHWSAISGKEPLILPAREGLEEQLSEPTRRLRDEAMAAIAPLLEDTLPMFEDVTRYRLVKAHSKRGGRSIPSLYKWLRMYWQNGQTSMALLPKYSQCGRAGNQVTAGRGTKPAHTFGTYQLSATDVELFKNMVEVHYFADSRISLRDTYQKLLERHYSFEDGNGDRLVLEAGSRPSYRQLQYFVKSNYSAELRLRARKGDKDFELGHRGVLGTVMQDCMGVGHYYEADATIADNYLVASDDRQSIIGKPTLYFIIDRWSRLIVGWYVGLENPSWVCAKQAVLSISEDKEQLCERYGVSYDPTDWPAHMVFPHSILADLGEWNSRSGEQLGKNLAVKVSFVPSKRADWKPVVESNFKQVRVTLQNGTPGFDPPENAKRRQGKHYEKDACLTLHEFTKLVLELVIKRNRSPLREYPLGMAELREQFIPSPINIWNKDIARRSGVLTRYPLEHVRLQLLATDKAVVTEHGIEFRGCLYTSQAAIANGWFVQARMKRFDVGVAFDHRLANNIYVYRADRSAEPTLCELSARSEVHRGRSFAEVKLYSSLSAGLRPSMDQLRIQASADYHKAIEPTLTGARAALAAAPTKRSRSSRRADTKPARTVELGMERQDTGALKPQEPMQPARSSAPIVDIKAHRAKQAAQDATAALEVSQSQVARSTVATTTADAVPPAPLSIAERARLAREKLKD